MLANGNAWEREKCPSLITVAKFMPSYDGTTARPSYDTIAFVWWNRFGRFEKDDKKAGCTATKVACGWAGAVINKSSKDWLK